MRVYRDILFGFLGDIYEKIDRQLKAAELKVSTDDFIMYYLYFAVFVSFSQLF